MERNFEDELTEARTVQAQGNLGRARTCARRACGMAMRNDLGIGAGPRDYAPTFVEGLRKLALDPDYPESVRSAAGRLTDRSKPDRTSASDNPVADAEIILRHLGFLKHSS